MLAVGKKQQIFDGALVCFEAKGFHGTAVPEIAAAAGVAVGTLYRHFPTKEALVNGLIAAWQARFVDEVLAPVPATATPRAALRLYWRRMAAFARAYPAAQRFLDLHDHGGYLDESNRRGGAAFEAAMRDLIAWGRREGAMKALEPALLVALMRGALAGLARHAALEGVVPQVRIEEMEDCLWNAVATRG